jgi:hypothetical protein
LTEKWLCGNTVVSILDKNKIDRALIIILALIFLSGMALEKNRRKHTVWLVNMYFLIYS